MAIYAIKYTRTVVVNLLVEADSEQEASAVDVEGYEEKVKAAADESNTVLINNIDEVDWSAS